MSTYAYRIEGTAADGVSWQTSGVVSTDREGNFPAALLEAQRDSFEQLTEGKAIYGHPGEGGCRGPYRIDRLVVERQNAHVVERKTD